MIEKNWFYHPTKKQVILALTAWFVGITLLTLAITDLFTESFFQGEYLMAYFSMVGSTVMTLWLSINYQKNTRRQA